MSALSVGQDAGYNLRAGERGCIFCVVFVTIPGLSLQLATGRLSAGFPFQRQLDASFESRMWSTQSVVLCLASHLTAVAGAINHDVEPFLALSPTMFNDRVNDLAAAPFT